jgi:hypothetical protein
LLLIVVVIVVEITQKVNLSFIKANENKAKFEINFKLYRREDFLCYFYLLKEIK